MLACLPLARHVDHHYLVRQARGFARDLADREHPDRELARHVDRGSVVLDRQIDGQELDVERQRVQSWLSSQTWESLESPLIFSWS